MGIFEVRKALCSGLMFLAMSVSSRAGDTALTRILAASSFPRVLVREIPPWRLNREPCRVSFFTGHGSDIDDAAAPCFFITERTALQHRKVPFRFTAITHPIDPRGIPPREFGPQDPGIVHQDIDPPESSIVSVTILCTSGQSSHPLDARDSPFLCWRTAAFSWALAHQLRDDRFGPVAGQPLGDGPSQSLTAPVTMATFSVRSISFSFSGLDLFIAFSDPSR